MKTAYFSQHALCRIDAEYRALRLESQEKAARFLPIRFVSRIVCQGDIDWSSRALALCLQHRVLVQFIDGHGELKGSLNPPDVPDRKAHVHDAWLPKLERLQYQLSDWGQARERQQLLLFSRHYFGHSQAVAQPDMSFQRLQQALQTRYRHCNPHEQDVQVKTLLAAWLQHELNQAGLFSHESATVSQLAAQLIRPLHWHLRCQYGDWFARLNEGEALESVFNEHETTLFQLLREELDNVQQWANEEQPFDE